MTDIHHSSWPSERCHHTDFPETSDDWREVTCPECRLERPMDMTGQPEYRVPDHVKAVDASLAEQDRARRLAAIEARVAEAAQHVADWNEVLITALTERSDLLRPLSGTESAEKHLGVPVSTLTAIDVAARLSEAGRYWLRRGPYVGSSLPRHVAVELQEAQLLDGEGLTARGREVRKALFEIS